MIRRSRRRVSGRCRIHIVGNGEHCGHDGIWFGGGFDHGLPGKRSTVGEGDTPVYHSWRGNHSYLFILDQTAGSVCPDASVASMDNSPDDSPPDADDYGEFQGTIKFPSSNNYTYSGAIRE